MSENPHVNPKKFATCCYCDESDFSPADVTLPSQGCTAHGVMCLGCLAYYLDAKIGSDGDPQSSFCPRDIGFTTLESTLVQCTIDECRQFIDVDTVRKYASPETFARYEHYLTNQVMKSASGFKKCYHPECHHGKIVLQAGHWWCRSYHRNCREHGEWHSNKTCREVDVEIAKARAAPKIHDTLQQQLREARTEVRRLKRRVSQLEDTNAKEEVESAV